RTHNRALQ
ncbi:aldehyde dehydrogenase family protein, partial [Vibrio parahaemolyticus V-223/04]